MGEVTVRRLDLHDDGDHEQFHRVRWAAIGHGRPHVVPSTLEESAAHWRSTTSGWDRTVVGVFDGDELVAAASATCPTDDNLTTAWVFTETHPGHRRRGHGRRALALLDTLVDASRTTIVSQTYVPPQEAATHPYRRFAEAMGAHLETTATSRVLDLPASLPDAPVAEGYRVESYVDGVPERYRLGMGVLMGLIDVDSPTGDLDWEPSPVTPERYAAMLAEDTAAGGHRVETVALDPTGEVVAYTELQVPADPRREVHQQGTLVLREHRGHGLGLAVKVANLVALQQNLPEYRRLATESDDANAWMVAINERLGFRPTETGLVFGYRRDPATS